MIFPLTFLPSPSQATFFYKNLLKINIKFSKYERAPTNKPHITAGANNLDNQVSCRASE